MPIYEYQCEKCGFEKEKLVKMGAPPPKCPKCEEESLMKRKISQTTFQLEGGGWAKDGYG